MAGPVETIFALLVIAGLVAALIATAIPTSQIGELINRLRLPLAAVIALGATAGSLYFSEIRNFEPCDYCWYQRIAMYPLGIILAIAAIRKDSGIRPYALTLAGIGALISVYHYRLQMFPGEDTSCDPTNPCSFQWIDVFDFISIPLMALGCFISVFLLLGSRTSTSNTLENEGVIQ